MAYEKLEDADLVARARTLADRYRRSVADLVAVIAELDRRRVSCRLGYSSTFDLCVKDLLLSPDDAFKLIRAARATRAHPEILSYLSEGSLTTRGVAILAPEQNTLDFPALLDRARGRTIEAIERLVAERRPQEPSPDRIKILRVDAPAGREPVAVYRFEFCADDTLKVLLDRSKDLLSPECPTGRLEEVLTRILTDYLERHDPLRRQSRPRGTLRNPRARRVPPSIRDEVWRRDEGRCTFVTDDGVRCGATKWLELDHKQPWALGGRSDKAGNIRLLCRAHNQWEAKRIFGER